MTATNNSIRFRSLNSQTDGHIRRTTFNYNNPARKELLNSKTDNYSQQVNSSSKNLYSSNPTINDYVIATKETNQNILRADLAKLPEAFHRPVFRSLSNNNKIRIFIEKINLLLATERLNSAEISHLKLINGILRPEIYSDSSYQEEALKFFNEWREIAITNFGWDDYKIGTYVATILSPNEIAQKRNLYYDNINEPFGPSPEAATGGGAAYDCSCHQQGPNNCWSSDCGKIHCLETAGGCGLVWFQSCDGECSPGVIADN